MRKLRHGRDSSLAQCHIASKWQKYRFSFSISLFSQVGLTFAQKWVITYWPNTDIFYCWTAAPEATATFLFFGILMDPAATPELLCSAQWTCPLFLCCTEMLTAALSINDCLGAKLECGLQWNWENSLSQFLSTMALLRDLEIILLCSLCIAAFWFSLSCLLPKN